MPMLSGEKAALRSCMVEVDVWPLASIAEGLAFLAAAAAVAVALCRAREPAYELAPPAPLPSSFLTIFLLTGSSPPACLTMAMNSPFRPCTRARNSATRSFNTMPSAGIAALISSTVGKTTGARAGDCAREEGREGEPGGEFLRRMDGRPVRREVSVSEPEP